MSRSILLLGTRNTSRSIMAEAYINHVSDGRWRAHSAGSAPADRVDPLALKVLEDAGILPPRDPQPKSRELFIDPAGPRMDVVVTLCEEVVDENLMGWPGSPRLLHWPVPDPSAAGARDEQDERFRAVLDLIRARADLFLAGESDRSRGRT